MELHDPEKKACQRRYMLRCKVLVKNCSYEDEQSTGTTIVSEELVFLLPQVSTERDKFYIAWMPSEEAYQELGVEAAHPLFSTFRVSLFPRSNNLNEPHLFVQSKGAEEILKRLDGQMVMVEVLGEDEDSLLDGQLDHDLTLNKNSKITEPINLGDD